jgi:hypothetical protein
MSSKSCKWLHNCRFEGLRRSCKLRLAQRKQRETRRCTSDLAYKFNRSQQGMQVARGQQGGQMHTISGGNSAGARFAGLMEDMPQELLPMELQQQQQLLMQQLQEYSNEQQQLQQGDAYPCLKQEQDWYQQGQQHSMPLPQLTPHHSLLSAATAMVGGLAPVAEELACQPPYQSQSMPLPALRMDSITSTSAAAAAATAGKSLSYSAGGPGAGLLARHSSNVSYLGTSGTMPASFGAAAGAGAAAVANCSSGQLTAQAERQLQQMQVQQQMQHLKALQQQMQAMMQQQQQGLGQTGGCMSGPLPTAGIMHQGMQQGMLAGMQGRAAAASGPLPSLSSQGLGLSGPLPAVSGLSAPATSGCHVSGPLPVVPLGGGLGDASAHSGQLSTAGGSTASALAGGIEHLLEFIDEGDEGDEGDHHDQGLPFTDTDLRSMLEGALESAQGPPARQPPPQQQQQQQQMLQAQQQQQLQRLQQLQLQARQQQQQTLQAQQQQQQLQQQLLQEMQELRPSACSSQTWQASSNPAAAQAQMRLQLQLQAQQLAQKQQQQTSAGANAGPAAAIRAVLQQKMQRIQLLQRMLVQQADAEAGNANSGSVLNIGLNSNNSSGNWMDMAAAVKPNAAVAAQQLPQQAAKLQQQLPAAAQPPGDTLMLDADMLQAQLQQLQQQCTSLKEEINHTKQLNSQDPTSVSCC